MKFFDKYGWFTGKLPEECVKDCSHSGECFDDVMWNFGLKN